MGGTIAVPDSWTEPAARLLQGRAPFLAAVDRRQPVDDAERLDGFDAREIAIDGLDLAFLSGPITNRAKKLPAGTTNDAKLSNMVTALVDQHAA